MDILIRKIDKENLENLRWRRNYLTLKDEKHLKRLGYIPDIDTPFDLLAELEYLDVKEKYIKGRLGNKNLDII